MQRLAARGESVRLAPGQGQRAVLIPTEFGEIWTSGLLDTCHDLGLRHSLDDAVIATEAALHTKKITWNAWRTWRAWQDGMRDPGATLTATPETAPIRHGAQRARTAARLITRFSESPRESQLRVTAETYLSGRAVEQVSEHFHTLAARPTRPPCTLWSGGALAWS